MTELQQLVWVSLGIVGGLTLKWVFELAISGLKRKRKLEEQLKDDILARIENKIEANGVLSNSIALKQTAIIGALCNMNTIDALESFSKQFKQKYTEITKELHTNPEYEDIL